MPRTQQVAVLELINELHDKSVESFKKDTGIGAALMSSCALPKKLRH